MVKPRLWLWGRKTTYYHSHHITPRAHATNIVGHFWWSFWSFDWSSFIRFLHHQLPFTHLSILCSLQGSRSVWPTLRDWGLCPASLRMGCLCKLFGILLQGRFASFPPIVYLFSHLFISIYIHVIYTSCVFLEVCVFNTVHLDCLLLYLKNITINMCV